MRIPKIQVRRLAFVEKEVVPKIPGPSTGLDGEKSDGMRIPKIQVRRLAFVAKEVVPKIPSPSTGLDGERTLH